MAKRLKNKVTGAIFGYSERLLQLNKNMVVIDDEAPAPSLEKAVAAAEAPAPEEKVAKKKTAKKKTAKKKTAKK
jgi:hypothetical protein